MRTVMKCTFCDKVYDWYDGVYENPKYDFKTAMQAKRDSEKYREESGTFVGANAIMLKFVQPLPEDAGEKLTVEPPQQPTALKECVFNLCPSCMHTLLKKAKPSTEDSNCFEYS